ncbi:MAG: glycosyltransferase family 39 protein [Myxococcales bacterium]|nr:glycosyltransferase family 39 protein [Myxococcales bacterium]
MEETEGPPSEDGVARARLGERTFVATKEGVSVVWPDGETIKLGSIAVDPRHLAVDATGRYVAVASASQVLVYFTEDWTIVHEHVHEHDLAGLRFDKKVLIAQDESGGVHRHPLEVEPEPPESGPPPAPLVLKGNPLRLVSGGVVTLVGLTLGLWAVIWPWSSRAGVFAGAFATLVTTAGVLLLLGCFDDRGERTEARALARPLGLVAAGALATFVTLRLGVSGTLQPLGAAIAIPAAFLALVGAVGSFLDALRAPSRPFYRREGFWLIVYTTLVLLPALGSKSLTDPWETHYGEVAREILARQDWISLWWAHEKWFMSKPILGFWMQSLAMATLGVHYEPGRMLESAAHGAAPWPEWAVRFPVFAFTVLATYVLYKAVAGAFGRRAGLLGGVVLTSMPQWFFIAHQTMTDMPFVASMSAALGFFLIGAQEPADRLLRVHEVHLGPLRVGLSARHLLLAAVVGVATPQLVYLVTRNLELAMDPVIGLRMPPIQLVSDSFVFGSAENCGNSPGNPPCAQHIAALPRFHPALQAVLWAQALAIFLWLTWGEKRARRVAFLAAFFCVALSTMAKGPAGLVLPAAAVLGYLVVTNRWSLLLQLEVAAGTTMILPVAMPWFVAMYVRHGSEFTDRLFFYDMVKRAFDQAHDTNDGQDVSFRYYIGQLGYGTFPWLGLLPAALFGRRSDDRSADDDASTHARGALALFAVWFVVTFGLFAYMKTKFHHYVLPALPGLAMLVGVALHRLLEEGGELARVPRRDLVFAFLVGPACALVALLAGGATWGGVASYAAITGAAALVASRVGSHSIVGVGFDRVASGVLLLAGAAVAFFAGRDMAADRVEQPSDARLLHLFTYNYEREWPEHLDFSGPLWAFTFCAGMLLVLASSERLRRGALLAFAGLATAFAAWALDAYFVQTSPHWGQRELVLRYVRERANEPGPLVAYQMNWKGENFYTGNDVAILLDRGKEAKSWFSNQKKKKKQKVFYVVTTHGLESTLLGDIGKSAELEKLTTERDNNKFVLVKAVVP